MSERPPCIVVEDLWYRYSEEIVALRGVSLQVPEGAFVAVLGQNGSGKTTLVKHLNGLLKPTRGRVLVCGQDTTRFPVAQLARSVGYVFQNPDHQIFCSTVREEVEFGPRNLGLPPEEVRRRSEEALQCFGLLQYAGYPPALLGFGLRRKVGVAAVYAMRPRVFILDEPTTGLDWRSALEMVHLLQGLQREGHTILFVTHDMRIAAEFAELCLVLRDGRVLLYEDTRSVFRRAETLQESQIEPPQIAELAAQMQPLGMPDGVLSVREFCRAYARLAGAR